MNPSDAGATAATSGMRRVPSAASRGEGRVAAAPEQHVAKGICVSPGLVIAEGDRASSEIDPQPELVLELDQAAELAELLDVLLAAECGEHSREVAPRGDRRPEPLAERLADRLRGRGRLAPVERTQEAPALVVGPASLSS